MRCDVFCQRKGVGYYRVKAWIKANYAEAKLAYDALMKFYPFTLEDLDGEIWEWIRGYEDDYQESNYGRTKSFKNGTVKVIKPTLTKHGYLKVNLHKNGKMKTFRVHKVVAKMFVPNPDNLPEINHEDGCKLNSHVDNLTWVTSAENKRHALEMELRKPPQGSERRDAKLTDEQVRYCRRVYIKGDKIFGAKPLARKFGVSPSTILRIVRGNSYKNVK